MFCGIFLPTKKSIQASKTPIPPGAVGTTKPIDHDKEKITNKKMIFKLLLEIGFVLSKFIGFYICLNTFYTSNTLNIIFLLVIFSLSWSIGLVVPTAPGGVGVFEACILFFVGRNIPQNIILVSLIYFRIISTLADLFLSFPFLIKKLFKKI